MGPVIPDAKGLLHQVANAGKRPDLGLEAVGPGTLDEHPVQALELLGGKAGGTPAGPGVQAVAGIASVGGDPVVEGLAGDSVFAGDGGFSHSRLEVTEGGAPGGLLFLGGALAKVTGSLHNEDDVQETPEQRQVLSLG